MMDNSQSKKRSRSPPRGSAAITTSTSSPSSSTTPATTKSRFRSSLRPIQIVCAPSTSEFDACIDTLVSNDDDVLIIRGTTAADTATSKSGKSSTSKSAFDGGASRCADASGGKAPKIHQGSTWDVTALQNLYHDDDGIQQQGNTSTSGGRGPSIVCIDFANIHGNDIFVDSLVLIRLLRSVFGGTLEKIIVKSRVLSNHSRSYQTVQSFLQHANQQQQQQQQPQQQHSPNGPRDNDKKHTKEKEVQVICAVGVSDYRSTIPFVARKGDHILEIGCHFGKTTDLLAKQVCGNGREDGDGNDTTSSSSVLGIDIGKKCIDRARKLYCSSSQKKQNTNLRFEVMDAWDTGSLLRECPDLNVIFVDVGGISGYDGEFEALTLVKQLVCAYRKTLRHIVIKSRCLRDHSSLFTHSDNVLRPAE